MRSIRLAFVLLFAAAAPAASARSWQGVTPGSSTSADVTARFGMPTTQGKLGGRTALVYKGDEAISGTRQAQFFVREDGVLAEVVVFPSAQLDAETVEGTYGQPTQKAFTDEFRPVWSFKPAGVVVFFGKDGFVDAISFKAPTPAGGGAPHGGGEKQGSGSEPPPSSARN